MSTTLNGPRLKIEPAQFNTEGHLNTSGEVKSYAIVLYVKNLPGM